MDFKAEPIDYNVADFCETFSKSLPKIVMVTQGFYGEISADTFSRGQILRLHTVTKQSRVIAKTKYHGHEKVYSIPLSYSSNFCIVKRGKAGEEMNLSELVREHSLPCMVRFPKQKCIKVGSRSIQTDHLPMLELTRVFSEIFLLGNFIVDGVLDQEVVGVPLYLSQLRFALVTGIVGESSMKWMSYQEELKSSTLDCQFDQEFGNQGIAEYSPGRIENLAGDSDLEYAKIEPNTYTNLPGFFHAGIVARSGLQEIDPDDKDSNQIPHRVFTTASISDKQECTVTKYTAKQQKGPPPLAPKPNKPNKPYFLEGRQNYHTQSDTRIEDKQIPQIQRKLEQKPPAKHLVNVVDGSSPLEKSTVTRNTGDNLGSFRQAREALTTQKVPISPSDVVKLSIDEVGEYLKALNLCSYVQTFRDNLIDGKILKELDETIMRSELNMSGIEALRLMNFAKKGHIPS